MLWNDEEAEKVRDFLTLIGSLELTWLEALVLFQHYYRGVSLGGAAGVAGCHWTDAEAARDTLVKKAAVALGYVSEARAGVTVRRVVDPITARRQQVKELYESCLSMTRVAEQLGVSIDTVRRDICSIESY